MGNRLDTVLPSEDINTQAPLLTNPNQGQDLVAMHEAHDGGGGSIMPEREVGINTEEKVSQIEQHVPNANEDAATAGATIATKITEKDPGFTRTFVQKMASEPASMTDGEKIAAIAIGLGGMLGGALLGKASGVGGDFGLLAGVGGAGQGLKSLGEGVSKRDKPGGTLTTQRSQGGKIKETTTKTKPGVPGVPGVTPIEGGKETFMEGVPEGETDSDIYRVRPMVDSNGNEFFHIVGSNKRLQPGATSGTDAQAAQKIMLKRGEDTRTAFMDNIESVTKMNRLAALLAKAQNTGPFTSRVTNFLNFVMDDDLSDINATRQAYNELKQKVTGNVGQLLKEIAGSRFSDKDLEYFKQVLPDMLDQQGLNMQKIINLSQSTYRRGMKDFVKNQNAVRYLADKTNNRKDIEIIERMNKVQKSNLPSIFDPAKILDPEIKAKFLAGYPNYKDGDVLAINENWILGLGGPRYTLIKGALGGQEE